MMLVVVTLALRTYTAQRHYSISVYRWQTKVPMMSKVTESTSLASISTNWRDYYELCKPQVVMLMILTSVIGMLLAVTGMLPSYVLFIDILGIDLFARLAAADYHLDAC